MLLDPNGSQDLPNHMISVALVVLCLNTWFNTTINSYPSKNSIALRKHRQWKTTRKHLQSLEVFKCAFLLISPCQWIKHDLMSAGWNCIYLVNLKGSGSSSSFFCFFSLVMLFWVLTMPDVEFSYQTDGEPTHAVICMCASTHKHTHRLSLRRAFTNMHATVKKFDLDSLIEGDCDASYRDLQITRASKHTFRLLQCCPCQFMYDLLHQNLCAKTFLSIRILVLFSSK